MAASKDKTGLTAGRTGVKEGENKPRSDKAPPPGPGAKSALGRVRADPDRSGSALGLDGQLFPTPGDVRLLVVDDEPEILNLLVPFLRRHGFTVSEAEDGDQALEKILTDRPNIVLLDVMMPGLNGWEISQYVRDRPELDPVRIIMATGIGEEMNAATSPLHGADAYIDKPFQLEEVVRTVRSVIERIEAGTL